MCVWGLSLGLGAEAGPPGEGAIPGLLFTHQAVVGVARAGPALGRKCGCKQGQSHGACRSVLSRGAIPLAAADLWKPLPHPHPAQGRSPPPPRRDGLLSRLGYSVKPRLVPSLTYQGREGSLPDLACAQGPCLRALAQVRAWVSVLNTQGLPEECMCHKQGAKHPLDPSFGALGDRVTFHPLPPCPPHLSPPCLPACGGRGL